MNPVPYLNRQLYIPELAVGRLVETPAQMIGAIGRFVSFSGRLDPQTALTTGYDFLTDGAQRVKCRSTAGSASPRSDQLINETWDKNQLLAKLLPDRRRTVDRLAERPRRPLPLPGAARRDRPEQAAAVHHDATSSASSSSRTNRLIFSMGCHAGLSVADSVVTAGSPSARSTGRRRTWVGHGRIPIRTRTLGVGAYLGNTGFGYGDTTTVAYSEEVNQLFAKRIAAGSAVGDALVGAKQEYFGGRGVFGVYDEKAMAEFTLYGLPMWSVTGPPGMAAPTSAAAPADTGTLALSAKVATAATAQAAAATITDPSTGLEAETFDVDPIVTRSTRRPSPAAGSGRARTACRSRTCGRSSRRCTSR